MAQQNPVKAVSQYPLPPAKFYRHATAATTAPPPPPADFDSYSMFGSVYTTDDRQPTLEESGRKRLYQPDAPPCAELRRLNSDLLQLFVQLVGELCAPLPPDAPHQPHQELVQQIEDTFVNMQYLINTLRPAQAAMDLKALLDRQTASRKEMADKLKDSVKRAWDLIGEAADKLSEPSMKLTKQSLRPVPAAPTKGDLDAHAKESAADKNAADDKDEPETMANVLAKIDTIAQDPNL